MFRKIILACGLSIACSSLVFAQQDESHHHERITCTAEQPSSCVDGVSSTVTGFHSVREALKSQSPNTRDQREDKSSQNSSASTLVAQLLGDSGSRNLATWLAISSSDYEVDVASTRGGIYYEGELLSINLGTDTFLSSGTLIGISLGLEQRETDTAYNGGNEDFDGQVLNLYAIHPLRDGLNGSFSLAYATGSSDQQRIDPSDGQLLLADFDSTRLSALLDVTMQHYLNDWLVSAYSGLLYADDSTDAYSEVAVSPSATSSKRTIGKRNIQLLQGFIGAEVSYLLASQDVYGFAAYRYDLSSKDGESAGGLPGDLGNVLPQDDSEFELGIGWRFFGARGFSANLEYLQTLQRQGFDNSSLSLLTRYEF